MPDYSSYYRRLLRHLFCEEWRASDRLSIGASLIIGILALILQAWLGSRELKEVVTDMWALLLATGAVVVVIFLLTAIRAPAALDDKRQDAIDQLGEDLHREQEKTKELLDQMKPKLQICFEVEKPVGPYLDHRPEEDYLGYRVGVKNSGQHTVDNVRVEIVDIKPSDGLHLPFPLDVMHDQERVLNQDEERHFDVVFRDRVGHVGIAHSVQGVSRALKGARYEIRLVASGRNTPSVSEHYVIERVSPEIGDYPLEFRPASSRLTIDSAKYGCEEGDFFDVAAKLRSLVSNNTIEVPVNHYDLCDGRDPCRGRDKWLTIKYSIGGFARRKKERQGAILTLP